MSVADNWAISLGGDCAARRASQHHKVRLSTNSWLPREAQSVSDPQAERNLLHRAPRSLADRTCTLHTTQRAHTRPACFGFSFLAELPIAGPRFDGFPLLRAPG
ncbi:Hypothetical predicted protein [Cloeon dipterum]|uniref:Uncharacterized protein n=1 Tax=Cloeon dipterum TaxID=197152 RepID=A0A8S1DK53_9INSE|nr:Hypothetical predicted protein [Cloeon dipterum]